MWPTGKVCRVYTVRARTRASFPAVDRKSPSALPLDVMLLLVARGSFLTARIERGGAAAASVDQATVPWWSFTKTALAAAALKLVAEGRLALDAPIAGRPYTLLHLLQHRSGLPDYGALAAYREAARRGDAPWDESELLARVAADRLLFAPGHGWLYSNIGYLLVRRMIEEAAGEEIASALRHLLFEPLGLLSARMAATADDLARTAWGNRRRYHPGWVYHGLLVGTPGDAVRFLERLFSGVVLPPSLLDAMTKAHPLGGASPGRPWQTTCYGLGLMIGRSEAGPALGHSGAGPGSVSAVYHFPERKTASTIAVFGEGDDEGPAEAEAVRLARGDCPGNER